MLLQHRVLRAILTVHVTQSDLLCCVCEGNFLARNLTIVTEIAKNTFLAYLYIPLSNRDEDTTVSANDEIATEFCPFYFLAHNVEFGLSVSISFPLGPLCHDFTRRI